MLRLNLVLTYGIPPEFRGGVHMKPPYAIGSVPSLSSQAVAFRWRSLPRVRRHRASKPQDSSERVLPWQITMDQLIFASLSHTQYPMPVPNILPWLSGLGIMLGLKSVKFLHPLMPLRQALRQLVWLSAPWISTPEYPTPVQLFLQGEGSQSHKGWRIWLKKGQGTHREEKD
ncbi:unnamed protein product, partial [Ascophyllum nodosum]